MMSPGDHYPKQWIRMMSMGSIIRLTLWLLKPWRWVEPLLRETKAHTGSPGDSVNVHLPPEPPGGFQWDPKQNGGVEALGFRGGWWEMGGVVSPATSSWLGHFPPTPQRFNNLLFMSLLVPWWYIVFSTPDDRFTEVNHTHKSLLFLSRHIWHVVCNPQVCIRAFNWK